MYRYTPGVLYYSIIENIDMQDTDWNAQYENNRDYVWLSTAQLTHILSRVGVPKSPRALDIGCGTGQLCRDLVHRGFVVRGVDYSDEAIHQARQSTVLSTAVIRFDVCDVEKETIDTEDKFDVIFCKYVFPFIANQDAFLKKVVSLKIDTGTFVVISPDPASLPAARQHIAMDHQNIMAILSTHFSDVSSERVNNDYIYYARQ